MVDAIVVCLASGELVRISSANGAGASLRATAVAGALVTDGAPCSSHILEKSRAIVQYARSFILEKSATALLLADNSEKVSGSEMSDSFARTKPGCRKKIGMRIRIQMRRDESFLIIL